MELFWAELRRSWIQLIRYSTEAIAGIVVTTVVFYGLFLSSRYIAGPQSQFGDRLDAIVVGYLLWTLSLFIMSDVSGTLQREAQTGTLEQLFLSPYSAPRVFLTRAIAGLTIQIMIIAIILGLITTLTGSQLSFPPSLLLPFGTVVLGGYGLALMLGSLALLLKQVQQLLGIVQFGLLFLLALPIETWPPTARLLGYLLPMAPGAGLLRELMARNGALDAPSMLLALINGVVYFAIGIVLFRVAERETKRRGRLGGY